MTEPRIVTFSANDMIWNEIASEKKLAWMNSFNLNGKYTHDKHFRKWNGMKKRTWPNVSIKTKHILRTCPDPYARISKKKYRFDSVFAFIFIFLTCVPFLFPFSTATASNNMLLASSIEYIDLCESFLRFIFIYSVSYFILHNFFRNGYLFPSKVYS